MSLKDEQEKLVEFLDFGLVVLLGDLSSHGDHID